MPSLNQAQFIRAALDSVLGQSYNNLELIVADGGSQDDTVDILKRYQQTDSRLRWFSEQDNGPAAALNKAFLKVRGTHIGWLNSDDVYAPETITAVMAYWNDNPQDLMVYGHGQHIDSKGNVLGDYPSLPANTSVNQFAEGCFICQPTVFFQRSMYIMLGRFDERLKTSFDFEYWLRAFNHVPERIGFIDRAMAYSRLHDSCITQTMRRTVALEAVSVLHQHLGYAPAHWLLTYFDEYLNQFAALDDKEMQQQHLLATIDEAAEYLSLGVIRELKQAVVARLNSKSH